MVRLAHHARHSFSRSLDKLGIKSVVERAFPERSSSIEGLNVLNDNLHSAHCRACKDCVGALLKAVYGDCRLNAQFSWPSHPDDYANTPIGALLQQICAGLGDLRGHRDFIKHPQVPPCDFHLIDPPFILEFDESQHFSRPRLVTLALYPADLKMGFSGDLWQELCREIDAADDTPIDRDERRAWYDTLRDLVPPLHGFAPTVRLYAGEFQWCALNPTASEDRKIFLRLLHERLPRINVRNNL